MSEQSQSQTLTAVQRVAKINKIEAEIDTLIDDFGFHKAHRHPRFIFLMNELQPLYEAEYAEVSESESE